MAEVSKLEFDNVPDGLLLTVKRKPRLSLAPVICAPSLKNDIPVAFVPAAVSEKAIAGLFTKFSFIKLPVLSKLLTEKSPKEILLYGFFVPIPSVVEPLSWK